MDWLFSVQPSYINIYVLLLLYWKCKNIHVEKYSVWCFVSFSHNVVNDSGGTDFFCITVGQQSNYNNFENTSKDLMDETSVSLVDRTFSTWNLI